MPEYPMLCRQCGTRTIVIAPIDQVQESYPCNCGGAFMQDYGAKGIRLSAEATPSKANGARKVTQTESRWDKDMDAYKRLRKQGYQPKGIDGSAEMEAKATSKEEIELGQVLPAEIKQALQESKELQAS